jgi:F-type H+-transporting ATPase subunit b
MLLKFIAAEEGGTGHSVIAPIWQEVVIGLLAFGVLLFIFSKYVFPRMEETFAARVDAIEGGIKRAEEAQSEAQAALEKYNAQLAEARGEAGRIRDEAREDAKRIRTELVDQAQADAARIVANAQTQIEAERAAALVSLRGEVGALAIDLASGVIGESLDEKKASSVVDRFLADLAKADNSGTKAKAGK